ncbi:MAG: hypothetical protein IJX99_06500 [Clostridia bacterium]|nr:hypothetical protein [Clostridia bacterium]
MEEKEYIELQNLLIKYRVNCMKNFGNMSISREAREKAVKQVRHIDAIRKDMTLIIDIKECEECETSKI